MALKTEPVDVPFDDGVKTFEVTQLTGKRAHLLLLRLVKLAGPALAKLKGIDGNQAEAGVAALGELLSTLQPKEAEEIVAELLSTATLDGVPVKSIENELFAGNVSAIYRLAFFAIKVNFADFFNALGALKSLAASASGSKVPIVSFGRSNV